MSIRTNVRSPRSSTVSTASRVVPGISLTISRSRPRSALTRLDLPTFGRPRIATRIASSGSEGRPAGASRSSSATMRSSRSPLPVPCRPEIGIGSPSPSRCSSSANGSWLGSSILFASTSTGLCASRRIWATSSSPGVTPARASTTKSTRSASPTASRACCAIARVSGVGSAMSTPPVSTSTKRLPVHSQTSSLRSRVTPGHLVHDRGARLGQPVDERRLADVREADDRHRAEQRRRRRRRQLARVGVLDVGHDGA